MAVLSKVKKAAVLAGVIAVGVVAGAFLASLRAVASSAPRPDRPDAGEQQDGGRPRARKSPDAGRTVDVRETEQGQPATRNYME